MHCGTDHFSLNGRNIDNLTLADYWVWSYSDLTDRTNRSVLAEFIVASALGIIENTTRKSARLCGSYNFTSKDGYRIFVESASYTQSFDAEQPEQIVFCNIGNSDCDVCIFCVHKALSENCSPLDLDSWDFYVIRANILSGRHQKSITLPSLIRLEPLWCDYHGIETAIKETMNI